MGVAPATAAGFGGAQPSRRPRCNPKPSGELRTSRFARPSAISLHKHPDVDVHLRIGNGLRRTKPESGLRQRGSEQTVDHPFGTGRYEAEPRLGEVAEVAVEAVLDRIVIHVPEGVPGALDPRAGRVRWSRGAWPVIEP